MLFKIITLTSLFGEVFDIGSDWWCLFTVFHAHWAVGALLAFAVSAYPFGLYMLYAFNITI